MPLVIYWELKQRQHKAKKCIVKGAYCSSFRIIPNSDFNRLVQYLQSRGLKEPLGIENKAKMGWNTGGYSLHYRMLQVAMDKVLSKKEMRKVVEAELKAVYEQLFINARNITTYNYIIKKSRNY